MEVLSVWRSDELIRRNGQMVLQIHLRQLRPFDHSTEAHLSVRSRDLWEDAHERPHELEETD